MRRNASFQPKGAASKGMPRLVGELGALIEEGETVVKDGLRGARHVFRQSTLRGAASDPVSRGVTEIVRTLDGVLTRAERTARTVIRQGGVVRDTASLISGFPDLLRSTDSDQRRGLVEAHYQLAKRMLEQWGVEDALILEQAIRGGVQRFVGTERVRMTAARHAVESGDPAEKFAAVCDVAASLALVLAEEEPVRALGRPLAGAARGDRTERTQQPAFLSHGPSLPTFLAVGLAVSGYAGRRSVSSSAEDFLPSAAAIMEVRFDRLSQCRTAEELASAYRALVPAMP